MAPKFNKIYIDWVSSLDVNAVATTTKTIDLIGVNVGCIPFLHALFGRMFCYPAVFPALGNAAAEAHKVLAPVERRPICSSQMFPEGRPIGPEDLQRNHCAFMCASHAFDFLMVHEIGHVINGHCDLLNHQPLLLERVQDGGSGANLVARQMLEIDADSTAVTALVRDVVRRASVTYDDRFKTEVFGDARQGLTYWIFAILSMWHCFVPHDVVDVNRLHTYTHPPARMRQISIGATLDQVLRELGYDDLSNMLPSIEDEALRNAEIGFRLLTGNSSGTKDASYATTPEANAHMRTVLAQWKDLYPLLEPLARYEGLLPKPH